MHAHRYRITIEGALGLVYREELEEFTIEANGGTRRSLPTSTRLPCTAR